MEMKIFNKAKMTQFFDINLVILALPVYQNKTACGLSGDAQDCFTKKLLASGEALHAENQQVGIRSLFNDPVRAIIAADNLYLHITV